MPRPNHPAKPPHVFGRDAEWDGLAAFAARPLPHAMLGVVSGRLRMGKTYLLRALVEQRGGFYFGATTATAAESLRQFGAALAEYTGSPVPFSFATWDDAISYLFGPALPERGEEPVLVVVDEFCLGCSMQCENIPSGHISPAHQAVESGDIAELTRLLDTGADPDEAWGEFTLLLHAIDVEADGAAQTGEPLDSACTAVLLAYGADPELPGPDGLIPRLFAFHYGHGLAVRLIESHIRRRHGGVLTDPCPELDPAEPETTRTVPRPRPEIGADGPGDSPSSEV